MRADTNSSSRSVITAPTPAAWARSGGTCCVSRARATSCSRNGLPPVASTHARANAASMRMPSLRSSSSVAAASASAEGRMMCAAGSSSVCEKEAASPLRIATSTATAAESSRRDV